VPAGLFTVSPAKESCQLSDKVIAIISRDNVPLAWRVEHEPVRSEKDF
jgi:hypothetical protein